MMRETILSNQNAPHFALHSFPRTLLPQRGNNVQEDYRTIRQGAALLDFSDWAKLTVTGTDRKTFLQGMLTNDMKESMPGMGTYSLFLTPKGKIVADLWVYDRGEEILLLTYGHLRFPLLNGLNKYLIMENAEIRDRSSEWALFSLQGPQSPTILSRLAEGRAIPKNEYEWVEWTLGEIKIWIMRVSHTGEVGFDILCQYEHGETCRKLLLDAGVQPVGFDALEMVRIEAGIPLCGKDIDDNVIPQEAGLQHALNFKKGCYVGQEVVARLQFRGHVNREWTGFILHPENAPQGVIRLRVEQKEVGCIRSFCFSHSRNEWIGIGFLRSEFRTEGLLIEGMDEIQTIPITVTLPPFSIRNH